MRVQREEHPRNSIESLPIEEGKVPTEALPSGRLEKQRKTVEGVVARKGKDSQRVVDEQDIAGLLNSGMKHVKDKGGQVGVVLFSESSKKGDGDKYNAELGFGDNIAGRLIGYDKEQIAEEKKGCFLEFKTAKDFWLQVSFINLQESPFFDFLNLT